MNGKRILIIFLITVTVIGILYLNDDNNKKTEATPIKSVKNETEKVNINNNKDNYVSNQNQATIRDFKGFEIIHNDQGIPVLLYHSISNNKGSKLFMPVEKFAQQIKYLKDNGYVTLTTEELLVFFQSNVPIPIKSVLITFDDGYSDNYTNAFPILKQFGFKATVFVITATIDQDPKKLTSDQIKEMAANGISIESHTVNHDDLSILSFSEQLAVLKSSKKQVENLIGKKVFCLAYPYGNYNQMTLNAAKEAGYQMAFTINRGFAYKSNGILTLRRIRIDGTDKLSDFKFKLKNH
jgi:peptidoglycan/xylan/chitin deacetylase (PgdA/CDA1 family)